MFTVHSVPTSGGSLDYIRIVFFSFPFFCQGEWALPGLSRELQTSVWHCRTPTAGARCLLDPDCGCQILGGIVGPQLRAPHFPGHFRTTTANPRSQWALSDPNRECQISVGSAGPQPRTPEVSGPDQNPKSNVRSNAKIYGR